MILIQTIITHTPFVIFFHQILQVDGINFHGSCPLLRITKKGKRSQAQAAVWIAPLALAKIDWMAGHLEIYKEDKLH